MRFNDLDPNDSQMQINEPMKIHLFWAGVDWLLTSVSASLAISDNGKSRINSETREPLMADPAPGSNIQICS